MHLNLLCIYLFLVTCFTRLDQAIITFEVVLTYYSKGSNLESHLKINFRVNSLFGLSKCTLVTV